MAPQAGHGCVPGSRTSDGDNPALQFRHDRPCLTHPVEVQQRGSLHGEHLRLLPGSCDRIDQSQGLQ